MFQSPGRRARRHLAARQSLLPEPTLTTRLLPACATCGARHPLANVPPDPRPDCPKCGARVSEPGEPVVTTAALAGRSPLMLVARAFHAIGRFLVNLANRI